MEVVQRTDIQTILQSQRDFLGTHQTKDIGFRVRQLKALKETIQKHESAIAEALFQDLGKSYEEAYLTEISVVLSELGKHINNVRRWAKPKRISTPIALMPSKSYIYQEPFGAALIIAPWNYPFQLLVNPLIGAISAGCTALLKPAESTKHTAAILETIVKETFSENYVALVQGGIEVSEELLAQQFDIIFFTGSTRVGKIVMKAAAEHLTPVILELGGKSPCIVDKDANLDIAAKRIAWGKTINAGQTCIAPDYLFVHEEVKESLIKKISASLSEMYGDELHRTPHYARIVDDKAFDRLAEFAEEGHARIGGELSKPGRYIPLTLIEQVDADSKVMQEEIFGPILPLMTFTAIDQVIRYVNVGEKPLALYFFGKENADKVLNETSSGGGCINDTLVQFINAKLPFGGVGGSGLGKYHGENSFLAFSHSRSILKTPTWIDLPFKYPPYKFWGFVKRMI